MTSKNTTAHHRHMAQFCQNLGLWDKAAKHWEKAIALYPSVHRNHEIGKLDISRMEQKLTAAKISATEMGA